MALLPQPCHGYRIIFDLHRALCHRLILHFPAGTLRGLWISCFDDLRNVLGAPGSGAAALCRLLFRPLGALHAFAFNHIRVVCTVYGICCGVLGRPRELL